MAGRNIHGQSNMISIILIAAIIIALVGATYVWAVPMIEKRMTVNDYNQVEGFMEHLNAKIVEIANSGSGEARIRIPTGLVTVKGYNETNPGDQSRNTVTVDFQVTQPIMTGGSVPIKTTSLGEPADFGSAEPRILTLSTKNPGNNRELNMSMRYRELRSPTPKGYLIAVCPGTGCNSDQSGSTEVLVKYDKTKIKDRPPGEGDLTISYVTLVVS